MTKKTLLNMIDKSTLKYLNNDKKQLYNFYYPLLQASLLVFPDKTEINNLKSLTNQCFSNKNSFEAFIKDNDADKIKLQLELLLTDIQSWVLNRPADVAALTKKKQKFKKIKLIVLSVVFIACIAVTAVLTALEIAGKFEYGNQLSIAFDGLGLMTGLGFFLYEKIDDARKGNVNSDCGNDEDKNNVPTKIVQKADNGATNIILTNDGNEGVQTFNFRK